MRNGRQNWVDTLVNTLIFLTVVAVTVGAISGLFALGIHSSHVSCLRLQEQTGLDTKYARSGVNGECYVHVNGQWIPQDAWKSQGGQW